MPRVRNARYNPRAAGKPEQEMGRRIRVRRIELGMSQGVLGEVLGISFQQIQKYEKGINRIGTARLEKIAEALGVPVQFFFGGTQRDREVETLLFKDGAFSIRLLRAYNALDKNVARRFVTLMEHAAGMGSAAAAE